MKRAIESLIEDIRAAHRTFVPKGDYSDREESIEKHFEEIEKWLAGNEPDYTLGFWCGLEKEFFFQKCPFLKKK